MPETGSNPPSCSTAPLPRGILLTCYLLLAGALAYALIARWFLPLYLADPIGVEHGSGLASRPTAGPDLGQIATIDERIDPNTADWPELTRLPGIGEVMAKRIVAYRQEHHTGSDQPVFGTADDLARVRGIGPKTVEKLKDQLKFGN
jgi:competence protein ComEA